MQPSPVFSIICPDYDGAVTHSRRYAAIGSVLRQSFPDWELIVIHDGPRSEPLRDRFEESDGIIYGELCRHYGYLVVPDVLGEHW